MHPSYASKWATALERDKTAYQTLLEKDPFEKWDVNRMPESTAERLLLMGTEVLYGDREDALGLAFVEKALGVADRALSERKYESALCMNAFPLNRAQLERTKVLANGLLHQSLDVDSLGRAGDDLATWCDGYQEKEWDSQVEAYCLAALRMALLGKHTAQTERLFGLGRSFRWHRIEYELLRDMDQSEAGPIDDSGLAKRFTALFDRVRDPAFKPEVFCEVGIERLELGLLWDSRFVSEDRDINWPRAVDAVAS